MSGSGADKPTWSIRATDYLFSHEKREVLKLAAARTDLEHTTLSERRETRGPHGVCDSTYVKFPEQARWQGQEVGLACQGLGRGRGRWNVLGEIEVKVTQPCECT